MGSFWGTLPEWRAGVGTIAPATVTLFDLILERREKRRLQDDRSEPAHSLGRAELRLDATKQHEVLLVSLLHPRRPLVEDGHERAIGDS